VKTVLRPAGFIGNVSQCDLYCRRWRVFLMKRHTLPC